MYIIASPCRIRMKLTIQNINISKIIRQHEPDGNLLLNRSNSGSLVQIRGNRHPARNLVSVKSNEQGVCKTKPIRLVE